jgi:hypothetical protein
MQILKEISEKSKSKEFLTSVFVVLLGTASFGLGRLSKIGESRSEMKLFNPQKTLEDITVEKITSQNGKLLANPISASKNKNFNVKTNNGVVVASKTGTKYHFPWCTGSKSIKDENKIWFNSIDEAKKAGYTPAQNCKGLK